MKAHNGSNIQTSFTTHQAVKLEDKVDPKIQKGAHVSIGQSGI